MPRTLRSCLALLTAALLLSPSSLAFDTPLSDQAVREAYFLGQRHDDSLASLLEKYTQRLPQPSTGPHIASIAFLTPFALLARQSSERVNYSAQQAAKDHRRDAEIVVIEIEVLLTPSYGALISTPTGSRSGSPIGYQLRSSDFWKEIKIQVFDDDKKLDSDDPTGEPIYFCSDGCALSGAHLRLEFPAKKFTSDTATVEVAPPEGDTLAVDFDLTRLR